MVSHRIVGIQTPVAWLVLEARVPFEGSFYKVRTMLGTPKRDPNLENYPHV